MDQSLNAAVSQILLKPVTVWVADDEEVPNVVKWRSPPFCVLVL